MEEEILQTIKYFSLFDYAPTSQEIHTYLKKKALKRQITSILKKMVKEGVVTMISNSDNLDRYTLPEYSKQFRIQSSKFRISQGKIKRISHYIKLLSLFPQIKLVGLSGTVVMMNAKEEDDIDLFIITARNRLFTGRFVALVLAELLNLRRKRNDNEAKDKVCLNLFFDEKDMKIPKNKQTEYVAHEVLQMKPIIIKGDIYKRFLKENEWVFDIFPNSKSKIKKQKSKLQLKNQNFKFLFVILHFAFCILNLPAVWTENLTRRVQLYSINKHKTKEIITSTQLWFHPEDFGKKMI